MKDYPSKPPVLTQTTHKHPDDPAVEEETGVLRVGVYKLPDPNAVEERYGSAGADAWSQIVLRSYARGTERPRAEGALNNLFYGSISRLHDGRTETIYLSKHWSGEDFFCKDVHLRDWRNPVAEFWSRGLLDEVVFDIRRHRLYRDFIDQVEITRFADDDRRLIVPGTAAINMSKKTSKQEPQVSSSGIGYENGAQIHSLDAILDKFANSTGDRMAEAVATLQADQDVAIRSGLNRPLVVNGAPGTGKTVVGLHRAAWATYTARLAGLNDSCLVVGPTKRFVSYVENVLVELHEIEVETTWIGNLLARGSKRKSDTFEVADEVQPRKYDALLSSLAAIDLLIHFVAEHLIRRKRFVVTHGDRWMVIGADHHPKLLEDVVSSLKNGRTVKHIPQLLTNQLFTMVSAAPTPDVGLDAVPDLKRLKTFDLADGSGQKALRNWLTVKKLSAENLMIGLLTGSGLPQQINTSANLEPLTYLERQDKKLILDRIDAALLDELRSIFGETPTKYGHVIVDEGQNLSELEWRCLGRRTSGNSITILGDQNQRTFPLAARSWSRAVECAGLPRPRFRNLNVSYRIPRQILNRAKRCIRNESVKNVVGIRDGQAPEEVRTESEVSWKILKFQMGKMAAACKTYSDNDRWGFVTDKRDMLNLRSSNPRLVFVRPQEVMGLEFDHVVLVEPSDWITGSKDVDRNLLYVAMTRATKSLWIIHHEDLPSLLR
jgi:DNA helicase IV